MEMYGFGQRFQFDIRTASSMNYSMYCLNVPKISDSTCLHQSPFQVIKRVLRERQTRICWEQHNSQI